MKTFLTRWKCSAVILSAAALCLAGGGGAQAALVGPYVVKPSTLHLWHLDDSATPAVDSAHYNYTGTFTVKPDANQPLNALFGGAALGAPSAAGYGTALNNLSGTPQNAGLSALTPANSAADNADHTFDNPTTHAFTMEAIVKIGFNPATGVNHPQEIIAGEGDASDSSDRSWQFRIEANATGTAPWILRFQKVSGFGSPGGSTGNFNLDGTIPVTGPDAIAQDTWFHVAVTYNGNLLDPASMKLYWTKLDPARTEAALLNSGNMNGWLRQQDTDFALGNELRDFNGNTEGFRGLIDEVRISDDARGAQQMQFVPEPSTGVLALAALAGLVRRRKS